MKSAKAIFLVSSAMMAASPSVVAASRGNTVLPTISAASPPGITLQPVGYAQGYNLDKKTSISLPREQIVFANAAGITLYTYAKDAPGKSNCNDVCTNEWKPLTADDSVSASGVWSVIKRNDGAKQWAINGKPVYTFVKDVDPGSVGGNSPARSGPARIDGAGRPVGGTAQRGAGGGNVAGEGETKDETLPVDWQPAFAFPNVDLKIPDGLEVREVLDAAGIVLVDNEERTLYVFDGDPNQDHRFNVERKWSPAAAYMFAERVGDFGVVVRKDGIKQWTYKGKGLYTYTGDLIKGDAYGIGADSRWDAAYFLKYFMPAGVAIVRTPNQGKILATASGKTLYMRDSYLFQDGGGHSLRRGKTVRPAVGRDIGTDPRCSSECSRWHPLLAPANAKPRDLWTVLTRPDGNKQWAYHGFALWTYDGDNMPGDMTGNDEMTFAFGGLPTVDSVQKIDYGTPATGTMSLQWRVVWP